MLTLDDVVEGSEVGVRDRPVLAIAIVAVGLKIEVAQLKSIRVSRLQTRTLGIAGEAGQFLPSALPLRMIS